MDADRVDWSCGECAFSFSPSDGRFSLSSPRDPSTGVFGARAGAALRAAGSDAARALFFGEGGAGSARITEQAMDGIHGPGRLIRLEAASAPATGGPLLCLEVKLFASRPFVLLRVGLRNGGADTVEVQGLFPLDVDEAQGGRLAFGGGGDGRRGFFKAGWHDWAYSGFRRAGQRDVGSALMGWIGQMDFNPTVPIGRGRGDFWSDGFAVLRRGDAALVAGFVTTADQFGVVHARCLHRRTLRLTAQADGIPLPPGREIWSEWAFVQLVALPSADPLAEYVRAVGREMHPRLTPVARPAQWSSWYQYFNTVTAGQFLSNLDAIDAARGVIPYSTVQLDDGYQSAWGDWSTCNAKFPDGLGALAGQVRARGYTPGLWLAPFVVDPRSRMAAAHPEWLLRDTAGKPARAGYFGSFFGYALDPSNPAVIDHIRATLSTVAREWGFGFVKTDFLYSGALPGRRHDPTVTRAQGFRAAMVAIREAVGEDTFLLGCGCPFGPAIGIVDAMRIGPDTAPCWTPFLHDMPWATGLLRRERSLPSLRNAVRHALVMSPLHRRWWWNDPDSLMVRDFDTRLTEAEVRTGVSVMGLTGGYLTHSDDLTRLSADRQRLVALCTPVLSPGGRALDFLEREMPRVYDVAFGAGAQEHAAGAAAPDGPPPWHVAALFNWSGRQASVSLDPRLLGYGEGRALHAFELWTGEYRLHGGGELRYDRVPPHGCRVVRLCPADGGAALVGDTLHVTQGAEIVRWRGEEDGCSLSVADLGRGAQGMILLALPSRPRQALHDGSAVPVRQTPEGLYALDCDLRGRADFDIRY